MEDITKIVEQKKRIVQKGLLREYETQPDNNIYTIVPPEHIKPIDDYPEKTKELLDFLKSNKGIFFKAKPLAQKIGLPTKQTQVELRKIITELIEIYDEPIVSNARGFTYAKHSNMVKFYIEALENRKKGLERRITALKNIYHEMKENETTTQNN